MMQSLRENTKIILWVVVVAFVITIFAVWGLDLQTGGMSQQQTTVGRVDGIAITPEAYQAVYTQLSQQFRASNPDVELSGVQQELLREQAWEQIVSNILTTREIERLDIVVTDEEILNYIRTSPPAEVREYFKDAQGNFDYAAYQQALNNPEADWTAVEQLVRDRVPVVKLNQYLMAQVHVSQTEVARALREENVRMVAEFVEFPVDNESLEGTAPTDEEVAAYYQAHLDEFQDPEQAVLEVVRVPIEPTAGDRADLAYSADQIRADAVKDDFAALAKAYSQTHTSAVGGETGFIGAGQRDPAVMAAVASLKPGEVSPVITIPDGVAIVQLVATKKEKGETLYNLREIVMNLSAGSATIDSLAVVAQGIRERAVESGDLAAAATEAGKTVVTTEPFMKGAPIPGVGFVPALSRFAFSAGIGAIGGVVSDDANLYVARVASRTTATARPLTDVAAQIKATLERDEKIDLARRKARAFLLSAAAPDKPLRDVAAQYGYTVEKTDSFSVTTPAGDIPPYSPFARAALAGNVNDVVGPVLSGNSLYVIKVVGRHEPDAAALAARAPATRDRLQQQKVQAYIGYWFTQLKEKSKIEDLREASS
jgi:peptidyl-prolyl cis-trans isomerase D